ncbi:MAG: pyridoxine 5'-phosphate synthase, partial [Paracoccaceae bacterium]|nr:pyridoxine 5'-phosphate synthase [Paracoccaceae bacterium]
PLREAGIRVSMFIGHDARQIEAAAHIGAPVIELHAGHYCDLHEEGRFAERDIELQALRDGAALAQSLGLEVHVGHGLTYETVAPIAAIPQVMELNIGHFLIGEAVFRGLGPAIEEMRRIMDAARN